MRTRRLLAPSLLALPVLALSLVGACATDDETNPPLNEGPVHQAFENAAIETGVPKDLLLALGWYETRWVNVQPEVKAAAGTEPGHGESDDGFQGGYGMMQLTDQPDHDTLGLAADLTELPKDTLKADTASNIKGAAHVLRRYADEMYEGVDVEKLDLFGWRDVLARWSGQDDPEAAYRVADEVFQTLRDGAGKTLESGEVLELLPNDGLGQPEDPSLAGDASQGVWGSREDGLGEPGVRFVPASSHNYTPGRGGNGVHYLVIHTMQGGYDGSISWFRNPSAQVSAHYCVRSRDGDITQMVDENDTAWHAGNWNYNQQSVGIEHEGYMQDPEWFTDRMYRSSAQLACHIIKRHNIPVDRQHIIGHVEVPGATHTDPGPHWDWNYYMSLIRQCVGGAGGGGTGGTGGGSTGGGSTGGGSSGGGTVKPGQGTIQGIVYANGNTSARIAGAHIKLSNGLSATTNSAGYWSLHVGADSYTVTASASGYREGNVRRSVSAGGQTWASVSLSRDTGSSGGGSVAPGRVSGVIFDASDSTKRIGGATIQVNGHTVKTDANGRYTVESAPGSREVDVIASGFLTKQLTATVRSGQTTQLNVGMVRRGDRGDVVGVVYQLPSSSNRIPGAHVTISNGINSLTATADGAGYFEFKGITTGTWRVTASASGYGAGSKSVSCTAGKQVWGSVGLSKATGTGAGGSGDLIGIVYESPDSSKRIAGASVTLSNGVHVTTDASGVYRASASGTVTIVAQAAGYAPRSITRTVNGQTWGSIALVKASPGGSNSDVRCEPKGVPVPHNPPKDIKLDAPVMNATVNNTPTFEFDGNGDPSADYVVLLVPAGHENDTYEFKVPGGSDHLKATSPKQLMSGPWAWSVYAQWKDCDKSEPIAWGFFTVQ